MNNHFNHIPFAKTFLTALFAGIIATLVCLGFNIWFRMATYYGPSDFINVSSIIFIVNILLLLAGVAYYAFKTWSKRGDLIYTLFFLIVIAFCMWKTVGIHRFADLKLNREFIQLLGGTIIIVGIATLCIPYLYNHKKIVDIYYEAEV
jgi:FtsH-binding integral membrane protein